MAEDLANATVTETLGTPDPVPESEPAPAEAKPAAVMVPAPAEPAPAPAKADVRDEELKLLRAQLETERDERARLAEIAQKLAAGAVSPPPSVSPPPAEEPLDEYGAKIAAAIEARVKKLIGPMTGSLEATADAAERAEFYSQNRLPAEMAEKVENVTVAARKSGLRLSRSNVYDMLLGREVRQAEKKATGGDVSRNRAAQETGGGHPVAPAPQPRLVDIDSLPPGKRMSALDAAMEGVGF